MTDSDRPHHVRVRLAADPHSVPAARQLARDAIAEWRLADLAEDAALCVSELTTNAALHSGSDYLELTLVGEEDAVGIVVDDYAPQTTAALVRAGHDLAADADLVDEWDEPPSTGRGLLLVSALASEWGIEQTAAGKRLWVRLSHTGDYQHTAPEALPDIGLTGNQPRLPAGWHMLRLAGCPVSLALAHSQHVEDLGRELQLLEASGHGQPPELAVLIDDVLHGQGAARQLSRQLIRDAAVQGMEHVDIEVPLTTGAADAQRHLDQALATADALSQHGQLLTSASTPEMIGLRAWVQHEVVGQSEHGKAPQPYEAWRGMRGGDQQEHAPSG